ncbi:thiamine phosphate synthase [bacterium]|nr:thiamine phosphate synthase [bacterium]
MELVLLSSPGFWGTSSEQEGDQREAIAREVELVNEIFENGLKQFHLRKPMFSVAELRLWLSQVSPEHLSKISLHTFHDLVFEFPLGGIHTSERLRKRCAQSRQQDEFLLDQFSHLRLSSSFHELADLRFAPKKYEYTFISPVFDSISKPHYRACFSRRELRETLALARNKVIALGGVCAERLEDVQGLGFDGAAILGAVWRSSTPLQSFLECRDACEALPVLREKPTYPEQQQLAAHNG